MLKETTGANPEARTECELNALIGDEGGIRRRGRLPSREAGWSLHGGSGNGLTTVRGGALGIVRSMGGSRLGGVAKDSRWDSRVVPIQSESAEGRGGAS